MAWSVADLKSLTPTSSGSVNTNGVGGLDDAESITIFLSTAAGANLLVPTIQISQFDPNIPAPVGVTQSTQWYSSTDIGPFTAGGALTISEISFRGLRLVSSAGSSVAAGTIVAFVSKQLFV